MYIVYVEMKMVNQYEHRFTVRRHYYHDRASYNFFAYGTPYVINIHEKKKIHFVDNYFAKNKTWLDIDTIFFWFIQITVINPWACHIQQQK